VVYGIFDSAAFFVPDAFLWKDQQNDADNPHGDDGETDTFFPLKQSSEKNDEDGGEDKLSKSGKMPISEQQ